MKLSRLFHFIYSGIIGHVILFQAYFDSVDDDDDDIDPCAGGASASSSGKGIVEQLFSHFGGGAFR